MTTNDLSHLLKENGFKVTPTRLAILNVFSDDCKPINAVHIHEKLKNKKTNIVTIYRTLSAFEACGILKRVDLQKDSAYFEFGKHHHHHMTCTDCGLVESFEDCEVVSLSKQVLSRSRQFRVITRHSLELFGLCKKCKK